MRGGPNQARAPCCCSPALASCQHHCCSSSKGGIWNHSLAPDYWRITCWPEPHLPLGPTCPLQGLRAGRRSWLGALTALGTWLPAPCGAHLPKPCRPCPPAPPGCPARDGRRQLLDPSSHAATHPSCGGGGYLAVVTGLGWAKACLQGWSSALHSLLGGCQGGLGHRPGYRSWHIRLGTLSAPPSAASWLTGPRAMSPVSIHPHVQHEGSWTQASPGPLGQSPAAAASEHQAAWQGTEGPEVRHGRVPGPSMPGAGRA